MSKQHPSTEFFRKSLRILSLLGVICMVLWVLGLLWMRPNDWPATRGVSDFWKHGADVALMVNAMESEAGLLAMLDQAPVSAKTPYIFGLAVVAKVTRLAVPLLLSMVASLNLFLLLFALGWFARGWMTRGAPWALPVFICLVFWGEGFSHSNEYHVAILPLVLAYPSTFAFALSLIALSLLRRWARSSRQHKTMIGAAGLGALVALTHSLTFFLFLCPTAFLVLMFSASSQKRRLSGLVFYLLALLLALAWPMREAFYGPVSAYITAERNGDTFNKKDPSEEKSKSSPKVVFDEDAYKKHYDLGKVVKRAPAIWMGFLFMIALAFRRKKRARFPLVAGFLCLLGWAFSGYVLKITMGYRFLYFFGLFAQIATAQMVWDYSVARGKMRWTSIVAIVAVLWVMCATVGKGIERYHGDNSHALISLRQMQEIRDKVGTSRVLGDEKVSFYIQAFGMQPSWPGRTSMFAAPEAVAQWLGDRTDANLLNLYMQRKVQKRPRWILLEKEESLAEPLAGSVYATLELETQHYFLYRLKMQSVEKKKENKRPAGLLNTIFK